MPAPSGEAGCPQLTSPQPVITTPFQFPQRKTASSLHCSWRKLGSSTESVSSRPQAGWPLGFSAEPAAQKVAPSLPWVTRPHQRCCAGRELHLAPSYNPCSLPGLSPQGWGRTEGDLASRPCTCAKAAPCWTLFCISQGGGGEGTHLPSLTHCCWEWTFSSYRRFWCFFLGTPDVYRARPAQINTEDGSPPLQRARGYPPTYLLARPLGKDRCVSDPKANEEG